MTPAELATTWDVEANGHDDLDPSGMRLRQCAAQLRATTPVKSAGAELAKVLHFAVVAAFIAYCIYCCIYVITGGH
jgi:hypothetical protein